MSRRGVATAVAVVGTVVLLSVQAGAITPAGGAGRASTGKVPGPPRAVTAIGINAAIDVSWIAPGSSGGSPVTGYLVRASSGGVVRSCRTTTTSCTISQLTNGVSYSVTARARNAAGWSHPSVAVNAEPSSTQQNCAVVGPYADLQGCNLTNRNLTSANLSGAALYGADLMGVTWINTTCPDGTNSDSHGGTCIGHGT